MLQYHFTNLSAFTEITHFISTRNGGVSKGPYAGLNLGYRTDDDARNVKENWQILCYENKIDCDSIVITHQVHEGTVVIADRSAARGAWADPEMEIQNTDAFISKEKNICIIVKVADCVPILIYDPVQKAAAAIHAGWRGTVGSVTENSIKAMINNFGSRPENMVAGIGPSIGPCCYEVGNDVENAVVKKWGTTDGFLKKPAHRKPVFDLWYANRFELEKMGVKPQNIETAEICTRCNSEQYFSARATGGKTGRFVAGIVIREER